MNKLLTALAVLAVSVPSTVVNAASTSGAYAGVSVGSTNIEDKFDKYAGDTSLANKDFSETAYSLYGGYRFNPYFALEAAYVDLGDAKFDSDDGLGGTDRMELDFSAFTLSALGIVPVADNFELYGKLGMQRIELDTTVDGVSGSSFHDTDMLYGAGVAYHMGDCSFRAEYEQYAIDKEGIDIKPAMYSIRVQYNF